MARKSVQQIIAQRHNWNKAMLVGAITNLTAMLNDDSKMNPKCRIHLRDAIHRLNATRNEW